MNKTGRKKLWQKLLYLDLICLVFLIAGFGSQKIESVREGDKEAVQGNAEIVEENAVQENAEISEGNAVQGDSEEQENTGENMETEKKKVALTFDDGPHPVYTPEMLDLLKEKNVKATFFLLGEQVEQYPDIVKRMSEEGHLIGNHSYKHEQLSKLSSVQACSQVNRTNELIHSITGKYPEYLRPPFGDWKDSLDCEVNMIEVLWDVDTLDWSSKNKDKVVNKVMNNVEEGDIILMHDSYESTVQATGEIIDRLQEDGYEFVTVDELIFD